jgi:Ca-activated chloride channel homolog
MGDAQSNLSLSTEAEVWAWSMDKMKKSVTAFLAIVVASFAVTAQSNRTVRPRIAPSPTPVVEPSNDDVNVGTSGVGSRPVLTGGSRPNPTSTPPPIDDDEDGVIRIETNIVTMPVSVLDRDGRFVSGLRERDFKIFEDGVEQKIEYFQSVDQPFTVVMLIDVSPSTQFRMAEIHSAAIAFVDQLRPGDRVAVIAFDEYVRVLTPATNNRAQIRSAIRQANFGNGTSLYEAVGSVLNDHLRKIDGRKAVVLFTDGVDTTSRRSTYQTTVRDSEESEALIYSIRYDTSRDGFGGGGGGGFPGPRRPPGQGTSMGDILASIILGGSVNIGGGGTRGGGRGTSNNEYEVGKRYLETISQNSGGRIFEAETMYDLTAAFSGIAEELRRQYSIGYYPEKSGTIGERRQIRIRVMRPNVVVRAKNSYIVGQSGRSLAGK